MAQRIVVIGGGAAGIGAAGARQGHRPRRRGHRLHRVRGRRLQPVRHPLRARQGDPRLRAAVPRRRKQQYADAGHRHPLRDRASTGLDLGGQDGHGRRARPTSPTTAWSWPPASTTPTPACPGADLDGLYYVKNIRAGDGVGQGPRRRAGAPSSSRPARSGWRWSPRCAHRGIETHLVDPSPWALSMARRPRHRRSRSQESWAEMGVQTALQHQARGVPRRRRHGARGARPPTASSPADLAGRSARTSSPNTALAAAAGLKIGSTGGFIVDERMATSAPGVCAAGDCIEIPHGVTQRPAPGPLRQPRLRPGQGGRHQRRRRRRGPTSRSTSRGAWSPASG